MIFFTPEWSYSAIQLHGGKVAEITIVATNRWNKDEPIEYKFKALVGYQDDDAYHERLAMVAEKAYNSIVAPQNTVVGLVKGWLK